MFFWISCEMIKQNKSQSSMTLAAHIHSFPGYLAKCFLGILLSIMTGISWLSRLFNLVVFIVSN
jgi:hypothetical protein